MIEAGGIQPLVRLLVADPDPKTQFEAAWALTNVASGTSEHTVFLIRNVIFHFIHNFFICSSILQFTIFFSPLI